MGTQEWPWLGSTHHRVAGLKHLTEQDAALLLGKRLSERIQDTRVPGIEGVWALRGKGRAVDLLAPQCLLPDVVDRLLEWSPGPHLLVFTPCVIPSPAVWEGPRTCFKPIEHGKGDGWAWLCVDGCMTMLQHASASVESVGSLPSWLCGSKEPCGEPHMAEKVGGL